MYQNLISYDFHLKNLQHEICYFAEVVRIEVKNKFCKFVHWEERPWQLLNSERCFVEGNLSLSFHYLRWREKFQKLTFKKVALKENLFKKIILSNDYIFIEYQWHSFALMWNKRRPQQKNLRNQFATYSTRFFCISLTFTA